MMWKFNEYKDNIAIIDDENYQISYGQLLEYSNMFYEVIGRRCLIFCLGENTRGGLFGYIASIQNKIVPLMLSSDMKRELLIQLFNIYKPQFIWAKTNSICSDIGTDTAFSIWDYTLYKTEHRLVPLMHDKLALLLTTSGSTGSPKLVRQTYDNIKSNTNSIVEYLNIIESDRAITTLPINYTYGISIINTHLAVGAILLVTNKSLVQKEFWKFFKEKKATTFGGVPYTYEMLKKLRFFNMELPNLRYMTQAGGKLNPELQEEIAVYAEKKNIDFVVMYGACEATARMAYLPAQQCKKKKGSIGIVIPNGKFELIDSNNKIITEPDTVGELVYYGKNVTLGYAMCQEDLCKEDENRGRLETGDMAFFDEDGYYYITGRKKRFLKVFGNRVGLDELELILRNKYSEQEFACSGVDNKIYIFTTGNCEIMEIKRYISEITRLNISVFDVKIIEQIPRNTSGKVLYSELEKLYD